MQVAERLGAETRLQSIYFLAAPSEMASSERVRETNGGLMNENPSHNSFEYSPGGSFFGPSSKNVPRQKVQRKP
jgi:hypothetical protein